MKSRIWIYIVILYLVFTACDSSKEAFENAKNLGTKESYEQFIANYPNSKYVANAKAGIDSLCFQETKLKNNRTEYKNFIMTYPDSKFANEAKAILDTLIAPFPQLSDSVTLPESALSKYNKAKAAYPADPVAGAMYILDIRKTEEVSPQQTQWLETEFAEVEEHAKWILERDFEKASANGDGRFAFIAFAALSNLQINPQTQIDSLLVKAPRLFSVLLDSAAMNKPETKVWQVSDVEAKAIGSQYSEKIVLHEKVLTAGKGFQLVRVTAQVQNVSDRSDPPYVKWALRQSQRLILEADLTMPSRTLKEPNRLASSAFIFLMIEENQKHRLVPCEYVCESSSALRGGHAVGLFDLIAIISEGKKSALVKDYAGSFVEKGEEFKADLIFNVPDTALKNKMRLMMLGAPSVEIDRIK